MRTLILRMEMSVDAVGANDDGSGLEIFDHNDDGSWRDLFATFERVDTVLVGAGSHREYLGHWQEMLTSAKAPPNERKYAELATQTPHFVLSRKPLDLSPWPNASVLPGGVDGIAELKRRPGRDIILFGGLTVASAAAEAGQVDEYHLVHHPVIAGRGKRLFTDVDAVRRLRHLDTTTTPSGVTIAKYAKA